MNGYSDAESNAAFELYRLWRNGADHVNSEGHSAYLMATERMRRLFPHHEGTYVTLAREVIYGKNRGWAVPR